MEADMISEVWRGLERTKGLEWEKTFEMERLVVPVIQREPYTGPITEEEVLRPVDHQKIVFERTPVYFGSKHFGWLVFGTLGKTVVRVE